MPHHTRFLALVREYLYDDCHLGLTPTERRACLRSAGAAPPAAVPGLPGDSLALTAARYVEAFFTGSTTHLRALPTGLRRHLIGWLVRRDDRVFAVVWASSRSVGEVARRMRTDPDAVLHRAGRLRLASAPGSR